MIVGLTHDDDKVIKRITKFRGKISAGLAAFEYPNTTNHPVAAGYFRILKEKISTKRSGDKEFAVKEWVINSEVQKKLEVINNNEKKPRKIPVVSLYKSMDDIWESYMAKFTQTNGMECKSHGRGTVAMELAIDPGNGKRFWRERIFDGVPGCAYENCPDFQCGNCKHFGNMKCFPIFDLAPNPYRLETGSKNSILAIESGLYEISTLLQAAHSVREMESKRKLPFDGFFGAKFILDHTKKKSGGREVWVTSILPSKEFIQIIMEPIKRGFAEKAKMAIMAGSGGSISLLESAIGSIEDKTSSFDEKDAVEVVSIDVEDQKSMAVEFCTDDSSDVVDTEEVAPESETLPTEQIIEDASKMLLGE
jgi:hypothetical protein